LTTDDLDETSSPTKYRIDLQIKAKAARCYRTDPEINLPVVTACHDLYDKATRKFNQKNY